MLLKDGGSPCNKDDWSRPRKIVKMDGSALCEAGKTISLDCHLDRSALEALGVTTPGIPFAVAARRLVQKLR